jgi:two-component system, NtrC family, response regulator AtoC
MTMEPHLTEVGYLPAPIDAGTSDVTAGTARTVTRRPLAFDRQMADVCALAERVAGSDLSVLIVGESGAGKELIAELIHERSSRRDGPFVPLNCAALNDNLVESELFGHERSAFTGAVTAKPGLLEVARGGTVFLDEIGEMPLGQQAKLLRAIEARCARRVGGTQERRHDVRFIAATNRLASTAGTSSLRADLYFRLSGVTLAVPPLRDRPEQILGLARAFVARSAEAMRRSPPRLSDEAERELCTYSWPGNVRELRCAIERAILLCRCDEILPTDLLLETQTRYQESRPADGPQPPAEERDRIAAALIECGGNQTRAAQRLGIARGTLVARLARYGLPRPRKNSR